MARAVIGLAAAGLGAALGLATLQAGERPVELVVSAGASMKDALAELTQAYQAQHPGVTVRMNYGGSGALQRQIEHGAPVDVFISAAALHMDALERASLVASGTRAVLATNTMVLVVPRDSTLAVRSFVQLDQPGVQHLAVGEPDSVPAGLYAQQVLKFHGMWDRMKPRLVLAKDVRQVLSYVESGNAEAGVVYATDAASSQGVRVVATAESASHASVHYPVAVMQNSSHPRQAQAFVAFLLSEAGRTGMRRHGFAPVPAVAPKG